MMRAPFRVSASALAVGVLLACGCAVAPEPTPVERDFGLSHRLAIFAQTANPDAEQNLEPVAGIEGKMSLGALQRYRGSFGYAPGMDLPTEFTKQYQLERASQAAVPRISVEIPPAAVPR